ncbi:uncharacterized protein BDR25DRAFT_54760 [Lindgomyces ingoldianus]|uniref:Uncharacterized protein n=1 Tax=Lindgomyces ingoldianus TaxID=673940 RepID=A0ACB6QN39_9PLEO|nr:uncharacterized protein BDR25DRAFT_54760 [Lindgomyces ingoldianus]KAF2468434.1 hypothetical protein BDR25DRAFT_54760 [Lindgomyces ingoldianus]
MSASGALVIISCTESDARIDPSRYFNLSANSASVVKTNGGRTTDAVTSLYSIDQSTRIGMIVIVQHTECAATTGDVDTNVREDITALKSSPYLRHDIPIIGYKLDAASGQLKEVYVPRNGEDEETRRRVLSQMDDFGPFWS